MKTGIISYGAGNVASVQNALTRLGESSFVSSDISELSKAERLIFPGVGHAQRAMEALKEKGIDKFLKNYNRPVLGICLGMQLFGKKSEEGDTKALGLIDFEVKRFNGLLKVPHTGWNSVSIATPNPLFRGIDSGTYFYFVHSFFAPLCSNTVATCNYENDFTAAAVRHNYYGVQFHPEKSGDAGSELLKNFIDLCI
jgi:imidazole glycerol-phosphate synthase subunit HisH